MAPPLLLPMLRPILLCLCLGLPVAATGAEPVAPGMSAAATEQPAAATPAVAPEQPPAAADERRPAPAPVDAEDENLLDETRAQVRSSLEWLVREVDSWFGELPFEQGGRVGGRIGLRMLWRQDEGFDWITRFAVAVRLPNLERVGGFLFVGRDNEKEVVSDRPEAFTRRQQLLQETRDDQSFFAGLGAQLPEGFSLRAGLRGGPKPYAQARYQTLWDLSERSQVDFRQTLFWTTSDGYGTTTSVNYGLLIDPTLTLRWQSAATWAQNNVGVVWGSSAGLYRTYGALRQLSLEALVDGQTGVGVGITQYGIRARWEQPIYRDWLLLEVLLGHFWPRTGDPASPNQAWALGASLQMRF